jgi:hypothetical protein
VKRAHDCSGAARLGDARDTSTPAITDSHDCRLVERIRTRRLLQLTNATNPFSELRLVVPLAATEKLKLEVCVTIDEAGQEMSVGEVERLYAMWPGDLGIRTDSRDAADPIDKNGAILDGWRRYWMDAGCPDSESCDGHKPEATSRTRSRADGEVASGSTPHA